MDLTTNYLGLTLKNPVVPSASPLSKHLDTAKRLEDAGASALVMYSLFEEEVRYDDDGPDSPTGVDTHREVDSGRYQQGNPITRFDSEFDQTGSDSLHIGIEFMKRRGCARSVVVHLDDRDIVVGRPIFEGGPEW